MPAPDNLTVQTPGEPLTQTNTEQTNTASTEAKEPEYTAKGAKDLAQAEADRLNAGGKPFTKPADPEPETSAPAAAATQPTTKQVAPGRAVLTSEGWLVGELPANYSKE